MKHYIIGYIRVSTGIQDLGRQIHALTQYVAEIIFKGKMTGTKKNCPELNKLLERITENDTVVIESLSRLGRSTKDLIAITELLHKIGG